MSRGSAETLSRKTERNVDVFIASRTADYQAAWTLRAGSSKIAGGLRDEEGKKLVLTPSRVVLL